MDVQLLFTSDWAPVQFPDFTARFNTAARLELHSDPRTIKCRVRSQPVGGSEPVAPILCVRENAGAACVVGQFTENGLFGDRILGEVYVPVPEKGAVDSLQLYTFSGPPIEVPRRRGRMAGVERGGGG